MNDLSELLQRHPAPWVFHHGNDDAVTDANGQLVIHDYMCLNDDVLPILVEAINAAAAREGRG